MSSLVQAWIQSDFVLIRIPLDGMRQQEAGDVIQFSGTILAHMKACRKGSRNAHKEDRPSKDTTMRRRPLQARERGLRTKSMLAIGLSSNFKSYEKKFMQHKAPCLWCVMV